MEAIITGDIINSRAVEPQDWMVKLKEVLNTHGNEPGDWEIYRGDSFQLKTDPENALTVAILIKSAIKQFKELDVRMSIGIGEIEYQSAKITESNGPAFLRSGECFETLKKDTLAIRSGNQAFDRNINLMLLLATMTMDNWSPVSSEIMNAILLEPDKNQNELAELLNKKSQSTISEGLKRSGFDEIQKLLNYYKEEINKL